jgi:predicted patatin/cPLA2 family phospholipase
METVGLVLEGGGMRGLYTAGVLEFFMENNLYFPYVIGVSAGACMAASYLSRQKGRNKKVNTGLVKDHRYLSVRNLLFKRELFGMDFLFDEIPNKIFPFDFETFLKGNEQFIVGTTDCETGKPAYFNKLEHGKNILRIIRASSSIPLISPSVEYNGQFLLDGGIIDPIPIKKSKDDGNVKNVIIMTKAQDYKKRLGKLSSSIKYLFKKYPKIGELIQEHHEIYNNALSFIELESKNNKTFVIQPSINIPVSRIERNPKRLIDLYELGYNDAKRQYDDLLQFINR